MTDALSAAPSSASVTTELAMRRTGMAFQRTRLAADRTLMAVIRTALSLISFGFTIYQFFNKLKESGVLKGVTPVRNFGESLVLLGIGMLIVGIIYHLMFMSGLRRLRSAMKAHDLSRRERLPRLARAHRGRDPAADRRRRRAQHDRPCRPL